MESAQRYCQGFRTNNQNCRMPLGARHAGTHCRHHVWQLEKGSNIGNPEVRIGHLSFIGERLRCNHRSKPAVVDQRPLPINTNRLVATAAAMNPSTILHLRDLEDKMRRRSSLWARRGVSSPSWSIRRRLLRAAQLTIIICPKTSSTQASLGLHGTPIRKGPVTLSRPNTTHPAILAVAPKAKASRSTIGSTPKESSAHVTPVPFETPALDRVQTQGGEERGPPTMMDLPWASWDQFSSPSMGKGS